MKHKSSKLQAHLREYVNPAYVPDEKTPPAKAEASSNGNDRKNSLAEIAATLDRTFGRNKNQYVHPFGSRSKFEEMVYGLEETPSPYSGASPGKLLFWMAFICFMVGMSAGVIYLAERYNQTQLSILQTETFTVNENMTRGGIG